MRKRFNEEVDTDSIKQANAHTEKKNKLTAQGLDTASERNAAMSQYSLAQSASQSKKDFVSSRKGSAVRTKISSRRRVLLSGQLRKSSDTLTDNQSKITIEKLRDFNEVQETAPEEAEQNVAFEENPVLEGDEA